jgi:hypothetical protein
MMRDYPAHMPANTQRMVGKVELPYIDEHSVKVAAEPERIWKALLAVLSGTFSGSASGSFARALGCEHVAASGEPGESGSTFPGFRVSSSDRPHELRLEGRHRFSAYALTFRIDDLDGGKSRLRAITHAEFPGLKGQLYKTAVIRSRGHVLAVNRMLRAVARRAASGA